MKLDWKVIIGGGFLMYVGQFIASFITGPLIHEGVLEPIYMATTEFWRPELVQEPPDMAALMPRWISVGLLTAFLHAGIYDNIRSAFDGAPMIKGLKFGLVVGLIYAATSAGWSGVFNLPDVVWLWWAAEGFVYFIVGGILLGWFAGKFGSD
jgi:hypothetical protein